MGKTARLASKGNVPFRGKSTIDLGWGFSHRDAEALVLSLWREAEG